jgi:hypothetical protein
MYLLIINPTDGVKLSVHTTKEASLNSLIDCKSSIPSQNQQNSDNSSSPVWSSIPGRTDSNPPSYKKPFVILSISACMYIQEKKSNAKIIREYQQTDTKHAQIVEEANLGPVRWD